MSSSTGRLGTIIEYKLFLYLSSVMSLHLLPLLDSGHCPWQLAQRPTCCVTTLAFSTHFAIAICSVLFHHK